MAIYFTQNTNSAEDIEQMNKVIDKMNKASANTTSNINQLTDLNAKAEELSANVNQALPINTDLKKNIEIGQPLVQEAESKNTELQTSLAETKKFINGLDGSQNIPEIRMELTELQNGLKSNQALSYEGSSISANDTLEGRTEGMRISGKTMYKKEDGTYTDVFTEHTKLVSFGEEEKVGDKYKFSILSKNDNFLQGLRRVLIDVGTGEETPSDIYFSSDFIENSLVTYYKTLFDDEYILTNVFYYDENKKYINSQLNITGLSSFNRDKNGKFIRLVGRRNDKGTNVDLSNIKIVVGSKKYTEYFNGRIDKKDILIKEPLRSIGDIFDYIFEKEGKIYLEQNIQTINLKDYTSLGIASIGGAGGNPVNTDWFQTGYINIPKPKNNQICLCNKFSGVNGSQAYSGNLDAECIAVIPQDGGNRLQGRIKKGTTIEELTRILRDNTIIYYTLDTPVITEITDIVDIDLDTYQDVTYVNIENSLPGTLDFKVASNLASMVQNMAKEVNNIWDVINNMILPGMADIVDKTVQASINLANK